MSATARSINTIIREGEKCGRYAYAKTTESIITGLWQRVITARSRRGVVQVRVLSSGEWTELLDNGIALK